MVFSIKNGWAFQEAFLILISEFSEVEIFKKCYIFRILGFEKMKDARYDRQLRLWGEEGQASIESASVCVLGSSALGGVRKIRIS